MMEERRHHLLEYYRNHYPFDYIFGMLSKLADMPFDKREFAFILDGDVYIRYLSFSSVSVLRDEVLKMCPVKIDIGAFFNHRPKDHKQLISGALKPVAREFVIDIDLTDYDDVRTCCRDTHVCKKCWLLISIAMEIVDTSLRDDFGFEDCRWIFSGRRGVHCWVLDKEATMMTSQIRMGIIDYISVVRGGAHKRKKVYLSSPLHPSLERAYSVISKYAAQHFESQLFFDDSEHVGKILDLLPFKDNKGPLSKENIKEQLLDSLLSCNERFTLLRRALLKCEYNRRDDLPLKEMIFQYMYPRLDVNVSKSLNHLLKAPFCVHPSTGKICVPIKREEFYSFDPNDVLSVRRLLESNGTLAPLVANS